MDGCLHMIFRRNCGEINVLAVKAARWLLELIVSMLAADAHYSHLASCYRYFCKVCLSPSFCRCISCVLYFQQDRPGDVPRTRPSQQRPPPEPLRQPRKATHRRGDRSVISDKHHKPEAARTALISPSLPPYLPLVLSTHTHRHTHTKTHTHHVPSPCFGRLVGGWDTTHTTRRERGRERGRYGR